jgi:hypothetical protein
MDCSIPCAISDFRSEVDENCALLDYYAASSNSFLPTIQGNLEVPSPGIKKGMIVVPKRP